MAVELAQPKTPQPPKGGDVESIVIRPSSNGGFTVDCSKASASGMNGPMSSRGPETHVFTNLDDVQGYIAEQLGGDQGESEAPATDEPAATDEPEPAA